MDVEKVSVLQVNGVIKYSSGLLDVFHVKLRSIIDGWRLFCIRECGSKKFNHIKSEF